MPLVDVLDQKGNVIKAEYTDGFFFPRLPFGLDLQSQLDFVRDLNMRDDDVLICAFPKCGTHWVWEMVQMLQAGEAKYDKRSKEALMIDVMPMEKIETLESPRTLNSHFLFRHLPKQIAQKKTRIIRIDRDPRDIAVSWYNHRTGLTDAVAYSGQFADFLHLFLHGTVPFDSWFSYTREWERTVEENLDVPVLSLFYEEMKRDPVATVRRLSQFLGLPADQDLCAAIAEACSFGKLREYDTKEKVDPLRFEWKKDHLGIYRKGQVGDWKNWFTVAQAEQFDRVYVKEMAGSKIYGRYLQGGRRTPALMIFAAKEIEMRAPSSTFTDLSFVDNAKQPGVDFKQDSSCLSVQYLLHCMYPHGFRVAFAQAALLVAGRGQTSCRSGCCSCK